MNALSVQNYLQHASKILGRDALSFDGMVVLALATAASAQVIYIVANSLYRESLSYPRSLIICALTVILAPLMLFGLEFGLQLADANLQPWWKIFLSLIVPGFLVCSAFSPGKWVDNFFAATFTVLPSMGLWFLLIILLNQGGEALTSSGEKAGSIRERTQTLNKWLN